MVKRCIITIALALSLDAAAMRSQDLAPGPVRPVVSAALVATSNSIVDEIRFTGLRRISPETLKAKIVSRVGETFDSSKANRDLQSLARTGWFETVRADLEPIADTPGSPGNSISPSEHVRLTFSVPELPLLTKVEYSGSATLPKAQIDKLLAETKRIPKLGEPANPVMLDRVGKTIQSALVELGHPDGHVRLSMEESPHATVVARFEITDGPHVPVGRITFQGNPAIPDKLLKQQMKDVVPGSVFSGLLGKDAYSPAAFDQDRERLLSYYQNHGYPEAQIGEPKIGKYEDESRHWFPWPRKVRNERLSLAIPMEAGPLYRMDPAVPSPELEQAAGAQRRASVAPSAAGVAPVYSAQDVEDLRRFWQMRVHARTKHDNPESLRDVEVDRTIDKAEHKVRVRLDLSAQAPYTVRRLEFRGIHNFPDRYFRRRIGLEEGQPLDDPSLEAGLRRLARTGYFKPIKKSDIQITPNDRTRTLDVTIHVEELGLQRVSLTGGTGQFGSTLGIVYSLFNVLNREELLASQIEGGPEILDLALKFAKEGVFGSQGSLALSLFDTFLKPKLTGSVTGPFYNQRTEGVTADWSYALSNVDTLSVNATLANSVASYSGGLPEGLAGIPAATSTGVTSSHSIGVGWTHNTGSQQITFANSVSGGLLGGSENVVRSKFEFGRIMRDPLLNQANAWAFRTSLAGVGSYSGEMPLTSYLFAGDTYVRGLGDGELGPSAIVATQTPTGTHYSAVPSGANLIASMNLEYRVPLKRGVQAVGFFDMGSGLLLPNWLGPARPWIVQGTNGILHGSAGLELRWTIPGVGVPVRVYYAVNLLRLNRSVLLPGGSLFHVANRLTKFGWGLGPLF